MKLLSVLIPAHNEAGYIGACLEALLASQPVHLEIEVIVIANGCNDNTAQIAGGYNERFAGKGWQFCLMDLEKGSKLGALNAGEGSAHGEIRVYLDADVVVSPPLMGELARVLDVDAPRYASGTPSVASPQTRITAAYARFWQGLPFVTQGVPGFGVFAMNKAGRARWDAFPDIISDDTFARLHFAPEERVKVPASYEWPMVEGFRALVKVRRRQDAGVVQIAEQFPALLVNEDEKLSDVSVWQRMMRDPVGFAVYGAVALATRLARNKDGWARGR